MQMSINLMHSQQYLQLSKFSFSSWINLLVVPSLLKCAWFCIIQIMKTNVNVFTSCLVLYASVFSWRHFFHFHAFVFFVCVLHRVSSIRTTLVSSVGTRLSLVPASMCALFSSVPASPWWVTHLWMKITPSFSFEPGEPFCACLCASGGWGDADLEAGLLYSSSSTE